MYFSFRQTKTWVRNALSIIVLTGTAISCSDSQEVVDTQGNEPAPILLQSKVSGVQPRLQNTQIESDERVGFYVTKESDLTHVVYDNQQIVADGSGGFAYNTPMYYPVDNSNVDFYAIHPYMPGLSITSLPASIEFSVSPNQTSDHEYLISDLLHASATGVSRTKNKVSLAFTHKLSRINFTIKAGNGMELSDLNAVSVLELLQTTSIDVVTGALTEASGGTTEVMTYGVKGTLEGETEVTDINAIVIPQTINAGVKLFKVTIGSSNYYYTTPTAVTYKTGHSYNYVLTIHQTGIDVSSTITEWIDNEPIDGEGISEE